MSKKEVTIIDYGLGNIKSLSNAFEYLGAKISISNNISKIKKSKKLVLPGVGAFDAGILLLRNKKIIKVLNHLVLEKKIPFLGICLGMQLIFEGSEEGKEKGFGWMKGVCRKFNFNKNSLNIPHIGWNKTNINKEGNLFESLCPEAYFYFVHSFYISKNCITNKNPRALTNYGFDFLSAFECNNIFGCQFHPEKSQVSGLKLLNNFLEFN